MWCAESVECCAWSVPDMRYVSTRGAAPELMFDDVLLAGLATDGGLYVPVDYPSLASSWLAGPPGGAPYWMVAAEVMAPYVAGSIARHDLDVMCQRAYATFRHDAVCPLVQVGDDEWICELFHGPTLAFKDVALQLVGLLFDHVLARRGQRATVVVATSGDTGSAAIEGVRGCGHVDIVVLFPDGRVSDVQRRQMTTVDAPNVHTIAVQGTFDDCQDLVKAMFADAAFREELALSAMNSINWARVMAQCAYYVTCARSLGGGIGGRPVSFAVPSGNFGNVLAGWVAARMGLSIHQLIVGSNRNDILTRFLHSGLMVQTGVEPTLSPSMDIAISSNVERLVFELNGRDGGLTAEQMQRFRSTGSLALEPDQLQGLSMFSAARLDDAATLGEMTRMYRSNNLVIDPHTAVGVGAGRRSRDDSGVPLVSLATAHPAKFPDAVERAIGIRPPLPDHLGDLFGRVERHATLPNDLNAVKAFVRNACRA
jgi:threonine synthase